MFVYIFVDVYSKRPAVFAFDRGIMGGESPSVNCSGAFRPYICISLRDGSSGAAGTAEHMRNMKC